MKDAFHSAVKEYMENFPKGKYNFDEPMSTHTTLKIGGPAAVMFWPESYEEITQIFNLCRKYEIKALVIGNGSNLLVSDKKLDFAVINMAGFNSCQIKGDVLTAGAGLFLAKAAKEAYTNSLKGMEFAQGIPGTVGGAVYINAGAYGSEMSNIVENVQVLYNDGRTVSVDCMDCSFGYRSSRFERENCIILSANLKLEYGEQKEIGLLMQELSIRRKEKQPLNYPSAGSVFKRPENGYAAALIEEAGLKGYTIGGAQVSEKHSGFIINIGDATFNDCMALIEHIQNTVLRTTGILLEPEVKIVI